MEATKNNNVAPQTVKWTGKSRDNWYACDSIAKYGKCIDTNCPGHQKDICDFETNGHCVINCPNFKNGCNGACQIEYYEKHGVYPGCSLNPEQCSFDHEQPFLCGPCGNKCPVFPTDPKYFKEGRYRKGLDIPCRNNLMGKDCTVLCPFVHKGTFTKDTSVCFKRACQKHPEMVAKYAGNNNLLLQPKVEQPKATKTAAPTIKEKLANCRNKIGANLNAQKKAHEAIARAEAAKQKALDAIKKAEEAAVKAEQDMKKAEEDHEKCCENMAVEFVELYRERGMHLSFEDFLKVDGILKVLGVEGATLEKVIEKATILAKNCEKKEIKIDDLL